MFRVLLLSFNQLTLVGCLLNMVYNGIGIADLPACRQVGNTLLVA